MPIRLCDIQAAAARICGYVPDTSCLELRTLPQVPGMQVEMV